MEGFDTRRQGYDPKHRPFRVAVYIIFVGLSVWTAGSVTWSLITELFLK